MNVGFLGLGQMGAHMARRLLQAGHNLAVWNRTQARADQFAEAGARVATTPADAARGADVVITMLFDDKANEDVVFGSGCLLEALEPGTVHVSMSTISVALSKRLSTEHAQRGIGFVGAPVFGRPTVAEQGKLWIAAAGRDDLIERVRPLFEPISRGVSIVGTEPQQAHALKLGGNFLISTMIYSLSEAFVYAESMGIEPAVFLETVNSALFQSPFYAAYGKVMLNPPKEAGATINLGAKDTRLLREASQERGLSLSLAETLAGVFAEAQSVGLADEDWAVGQYRVVQRRTGTKTS